MLTKNRMVPFAFVVLFFPSFFLISIAQAADFGVFGDVQFKKSTLASDKSAFALGQFDFYASAPIDDKTRVFFELVFENNGKSFNTDLERLLITRDFSDEFQLHAGRFHTPLGYWNATYHHGALIQDTISRPGFLEFEDAATAALPMHVVGLMATGRLKTGAGAFGYSAFTGNGPSIDTSAGFNPPVDTKPEIEINNVSDANSAKSLGARINFAPHGTPLSVGLFGMHNNVAESAKTGGVAPLGSTLVEQTITGLDAQLLTGKFYALAEYYHLANKNKVGASGNHTATAYYGQLGYTVVDKTKLIYRHESIGFDANDTYFRLLGSGEQVRNVIALHYEVSETNALKFEANHINPRGGSPHTVYSVQWAFLMP